MRKWRMFMANEIAAMCMTKRARVQCSNAKIIILISGEPEVTKSQEELEDTTNLKYQKTPITQKPGLLAAIVGGAVVGLLCAILLVMFIVYRTRKKDEGSYPLDEPRPRNYPYTKAPDKEFYA